MIPAFVLGASQALTRRLNQEYVNYLDSQKNEAEVQRNKENAQGMYQNAIASGLTQENGWAVVPNPLSGDIKIQAINQYSGTKKDDADPLPKAEDLAFKAALGIDKSQFGDYDFVKITPNLTPTDVQNGYITVGNSRIPIKDGEDYMLFDSLASTTTERSDENVRTWLDTIKTNEDGFKKAIIAAKNGNPEALDKLLTLGVSRASAWQRIQKGDLVEGQTYFSKSPFSVQGPLYAMKDLEVFQDDIVMGRFAELTAENSPQAFLSSLNEVGFKVPINNPVVHTLDDKVATIRLDGEWDEYLEPVDPNDRSRSARRQVQWNAEFQNIVGGWSARSSRDQFEWFQILQQSKNPRKTFDTLVEFQSEMAKLGQPVDVTGGRPVYRSTWANAVKPKFISLINELSAGGVNLAGGDMTAIIAAMLPEDMYKGIRMQVFSSKESAHYYVDPGLNIEEAAETISTYSSNISLAKDILSTIDKTEEGSRTGFAGNVTEFKYGLRAQIQQFQNMFSTGDRDPDLQAYMGPFRGFFTEEELDPDNLDKLSTEALLIKQRKFAVIRLMYSFAKNMGGTGSDRLSDQDAKNALLALQTSGLLNSAQGMRIVMNTLISKMSKRVQILEGLKSQEEREIVAGVFLRDLYRSDHGMSITSAIESARMEAFEARIPGVRDPADDASQKRDVL